MPETTEEVRTHRCLDCPLPVEHSESELCSSCGRCACHCYDPTNHNPPETQLPKRKRTDA